MKAFSKSLLTGCLLFCVVVFWGFSSDAATEEELSGSRQLDKLIQEAMEQNPEILAAKNRWQSAEEIIEARRAFPDPQAARGPTWRYALGR